MQNGAKGSRAAMLLAQGHFSLKATHAIIGVMQRQHLGQIRLRRIIPFAPLEHKGKIKILQALIHHCDHTYLPPQTSPP